MTTSMVQTPFDMAAMVSSAAVERLMKSADSLDFALSTTLQDKKAVGGTAPVAEARQDFSNFDGLFEASDLSANLFDDWLSTDLQQVVYLSQSESSSESSTSSPTLSTNAFDEMDHSQNNLSSPALGFDSIASDAELIMSPAFDSNMAFFPEVQAAASTSFANPAPMMQLTAESVQQAAAALNIPWSKGLEEAVLAQSLLASLPMLGMPVRQPVAITAPVSAVPTVPSSPVVAAAAAVSFVAQPAAVAVTPAVATPAATTATKTTANVTFVRETGFSAPVATVAPTSEAKAEISSLLSNFESSSSASASSSKPETPAPAPYKSSFRTSSLIADRRTLLGVKREREIEYEEPPSVLEGKDIADMDEVSLKRAKNTDAARRSRRKKLIKMESLEKRVMELEFENEMFETKLNQTERERQLLEEKEMHQRQRIEELEKILEGVKAKLL